VKRVEAVKRTVELAPITADIERVHEGLTLLSETVAGLQVDDPTLRTKILDAVSEVFSQLNRARALTAARTKELRGAEGRAEFGAQVKVFAQAVQSALAVADSPEKCDQSLARLTVQVEELEGRFGEFDEFAAELAAKRDELNDAFGALYPVGDHMLRFEAVCSERQRERESDLVQALAALDPLKELPRSRTDAPASAAPYSGDREGEEASAASASAASASAAAAAAAASAAAARTAAFRPPAPRSGVGKDSTQAMNKLARSLAELVGGDGGSAEARERRRKRGPF
jgi:hypothetical protein